MSFDNIDTKIAQQLLCNRTSAVVRLSFS